MLSSAVSDQEQGVEVGQDKEQVTATAFLLLAIMEEGWVTELRALLHGNEKTWVVRNFLLHHLISAFVYGVVGESESTDLMELCVDIIQSTQGYDSDAQRKRHRSDLMNSLRRSRLKNGAQDKQIDELYEVLS